MSNQVWLEDQDGKRVSYKREQKAGDIDFAMLQPMTLLEQLTIASNTGRRIVTCGTNRRRVYVGRFLSVYAEPLA